MSQDQTDEGGSGTAPTGTAPTGAELPEYAERVLDVTDLIPPGRVMTYGDIAEWLGEGGPRQVGRVMALYGSAVPWWRVVRSDGTLLPTHELRALDHYRAEGTPLREASHRAEGHIPRIDMRRARWDGGVRPDGGGGESGRTGAAPDEGRGAGGDAGGDVSGDPRGAGGEARGAGGDVGGAGGRGGRAGGRGEKAHT
ncbi:MGMT family protein [Streptomyces sp. CA-278952]|uniref:MGMT family protein n=1 Tax=Streptomyces sp. CA-278952 TaxID=2980556 RepID=UPI002367E169|nr:MGMT family protein [Streptomyces sp. CA-278952]WDG28822.1 MGMT family protein [Streptomyces sp. CA-278952]